jgi:TPP-dependent pyruvate/acetoin dehydrogenase alpha subunit
VTGSGCATIVFFGDGAFGAGIVHESMNFASNWALPVVYVCEHNGYQDHTRTEDVYPDPSLARFAEGHRIPSEKVDGNDVLAVHAAVSRALDRARAGGGPSFIEAVTYLRRFHLQFDEAPPPYRPPSEEAAWLGRDPIEHAGKALLMRGTDRTGLTRIASDGAASVDAAVQAVLQSAPRLGGPAEKARAGP